MAFWNRKVVLDSEIPTRSLQSFNDLTKEEIQKLVDEQEDHRIDKLLAAGVNVFGDEDG